VKKKKAAEARPKNLPARELSSKRAEGVKAGRSAENVQISEIHITKPVDE
jgi:hypothetical protein